MPELCKTLEYVAKFIAVFTCISAIVAAIVFGTHVREYAKATNANGAVNISKAMICGGARYGLDEVCPRDSADEVSEHVKTRVHIDRSLASSFEMISAQNTQLVKECRSDAATRMSKLSTMLDANFQKMDGAQKAHCAQLYAEIHALNVTLSQLNATDKALADCQTKHSKAELRLSATNGFMSIVSLMVFSGALFAAADFKQVYFAMAIVSVGVLEQILVGAEWVDPHWVKCVGSLGLFCLSITMHTCMGSKRDAPTTTTTTTNNYIYKVEKPLAAPAQGTEGPRVPVPVVFQPSGLTHNMKMNTWDKME